MGKGNGEMTTEDRLSKAEHILTAHIEQAKKDYEENRRLWRDHQTDIDAIWKRMERRDEEYRKAHEEFRQEMKIRDAEYNRRSKETGEDLDRRIGILVSSIGELCRRLDAAIERKNGKD